MPPTRTPGPQGVNVASVPVAKAAKVVACTPGLGVDQVAHYVGLSIEDICPFGYGKKKDDQNHCAHFVSHALNIQVKTLCSYLLPWSVKDSSTDPLYRAGVRQNISDGLFSFEGKQKNPLKGASTRVNEIYNSIPKESKGDWDSRPVSKPNCLIYVTIPDNISKDRATLGDRSRKHIGIHKDGKVFHYGNTDDEVKCDTVEEFKRKFLRNYGADALFLWSEIPVVGEQCVHRGGTIGG